ncbi:MAG: diacylglycerol/polyprenol kinase family protein [Aquificaceae bacterium]
MLEIRRKAFHLLAISLWLVPLLTLQRKITIALFFVVIALNLLIVFKVGISRFKALYDLVFYLERERNIKRPSIQALWANIGIFLSFLLFGSLCASAGVVLLAVGDAFAGLVGISVGRRRIFRKSLEGSLAFFFSSFFALLLLLDVKRALIISSVGTLTELLPLKLDDNFLIPICGSLVCFLL